MTTKGDLVDSSYELVGYDNVDDTLREKGVKILERMMYVWYNQFIDIGYSFADSTDTPEAADESDLTPISEDAVIMNLALKLASVAGILTGGTLMSDAKIAKDNLYQLTPPSIASNPYMPLGAGATGRCSRVVYQSEDEGTTPLTYGGQPLEG
jgi:hypothetical protein